MAPTIQQQPQPLTKNVGETATFTVKATGDGTLEYEWTHNGESLVAKNPTAATNTLAVESVKEEDKGTYRVEVTDGTGNEQSNPVELILETEAVPAVPLVWDSAFAKTAAISVGSAAGVMLLLTLALTLWLGKPTADSIKFPSSVAISLIVIGICVVSIAAFAALLEQRGRARIIEQAQAPGTKGISTSIIEKGPELLNAFGKLGVFSALLVIAAVLFGVSGALAWKALPATLAETVPSVEVQPSAQSITAGEDATFSVEADGDDLTFQWLKNGEELEDESGLEGVSSATLVVKAVDDDDAGAYRVVIANEKGVILSDGASLKVQ